MKAILFSCAAAALLCTSCVTKEKYMLAENGRLEALARADRLNSELNVKRTENAQLSDRLAALCRDRGVRLIVDAAESLGATYRGRPAGKGAWAAVHSLNGNKIVTAGGGGLLLTDDPDLLARCRKLAGQGREPVPWYEHRTLGTHGRLGNVPAAIGLAQFRHLDDALRDKARVWADWLARLPGWATPMPTAPYGVPNRWLTVVTLEGRDPLRAVAALAARGLEARPLWKPMHLQPVFQGAPALLSGVGEALFARGLCLPSGRGLDPVSMEEAVSVLEQL